MLEAFGDVVALIVCLLVGVALAVLLASLVNEVIREATDRDLRDWWRRWRTPKAPVSDLDRAIAEVADEIEKRAAVIVRETACDRGTALHRARKEYQAEMGEVATATGGSRD